MGRARTVICSSASRWIWIVPASTSGNRSPDSTPENPCRVGHASACPPQLLSGQAEACPTPVRDYLRIHLVTRPLESITAAKWYSLVRSMGQGNPRYLSVSRYSAALSGALVNYIGRSAARLNCVAALKLHRCIGPG